MENFLLSPEKEGELCSLIENEKMDEFFDQVEGKSPLNANVLQKLVEKKGSQELSKALELCYQCEDNVYDFLVSVWGKEKADEYWIRHATVDALERKFDDETLVKYKLWNLLLKKGAYEAVVDYAPLDILIKLKVKNPQVLVNLLCKRKRFHDLARIGYIPSWVPNEALIFYWNTNDLDTLLKIHNIGKEYALFGFASEDDFYKYLYEHGKEDYFLTHTDFLMRHRIAEPYLKKHNWQKLAAMERYDLIDWEAFLASPKNKGVFKFAAKAHQWAFLEKHNQKWMLFICFRWSRLWRLLKK